ncbi:MAG: alpha/beta hydrolase-fold protein [Chloroflexota bacterium]
MPDAPSQPWTMPEPHIPTGRVTLHQIHSDILQNTQNICVYTPAGYSQNQETCALLVLFAGTIYTDSLTLPTILDNLIAAGRIKPTIAVLLDSPNRGKELFFDTRFVDFLIKEMLPWLRSAYHVTAEPAKAVVGGMSLGGLMAAFVALHHPEVFGNVLSQSGSFSYGQNSPVSYSPEIDLEEEWLTHQYATREKLSLRFYLDVGILENYRDQSQITLLRANRHLRDVLQARGYPVHYTEFGGGHQYFNWRNTLPDALIALLGRS